MFVVFHCYFLATSASAKENEVKMFESPKIIESHLAVDPK